MAQADLVLEAHYPDEDFYHCHGQCDRCGDPTCEEHPSQRWKWDIEATEVEFCHFGGMGQYVAGYERCNFVCPLRDSCRMLTERLEANDG